MSVNHEFATPSAPPTSSSVSSASRSQASMGWRATTGSCCWGLGSQPTPQSRPQRYRRSVHGGCRRGLRSARTVNLTIGAVYLPVGLLGVVIPRDQPVNLLALNMADNWLHLFSGAAALAVGALADKASAGR